MKVYNFLLNIIFIIKHIFGQIKITDKYLPNRYLTFEEDFTSDVIDRNKWNTSFSWESHGDGSKVTDGKNIIIKYSVAQFVVKFEPGVTIGWWGTHYYNFTRAHLDSYGKFSQKYGRFECKARVKNIKGLFPAFWTLTNTHVSNGISTIKPEIDIFEHFDNDKGKKQIGCSLHYGLTYDDPTSKRTTSFIKGIDFSNVWAIYSVEWTVDTIKWYINNQLVKVFNIEDIEENLRPTHPMYIIVNEGVHSNTLLPNAKYLPQGMEIDWIRVYK